MLTTVLKSVSVVLKTLHDDSGVHSMVGNGRQFSTQNKLLYSSYNHVQAAVFSKKPSHTTETLRTSVISRVAQRTITFKRISTHDSDSAPSWETGMLGQNGKGEDGE